MDLSTLRPAAGATHKRKRVGRGNASGKGTTAGRGTKGQQSRSGKGMHPGFEGGQFPLYRRLAKKRGFTNRFRVEYEPVNVGDLVRFEANATVTPEMLVGAGVVKHSNMPVKVLAGGELDRALTVRAHKFSAAAAAKIEAAGGRVESLEGAEAAIGHRRTGGRTVATTAAAEDVAGAEAAGTDTAQTDTAQAETAQAESAPKGTGEAEAARDDGNRDTE
jgi:large subunit ribosomal protein L15